VKAKSILLGVCFTLGFGCISVRAMDMKLVASLKPDQLTQANVDTLFLESSRSGDLQSVKHCLSLGADKNAASNKFGYSAHHLAAAHGHVEVLKFLAKDDEKARFYCLDGFSPFQVAAKYNKTNVMEWCLVQKKVDVHEANGKGITALHLACAYGSLDAAKLLIQERADVNCKDSLGMSPAHYVVQKGYLDVLKLLIAHGADWKAVDNKQSTMLHLAAQGNQHLIVKYLLDNKKHIDVNAQGYQCNATALHLAAANGCVQVGKLLLPHVDMHAKFGEKTQDAFGIACINHNFEFAALLLPYVDINKILDEESQNTLLFDAVALNKLESVKFLVQNGANIQCKTIKGFGPIRVAEAFGYNDIANYLKEREQAQKAEEDLCSPSQQQAEQKKIAQKKKVARRKAAKKKKDALKKSENEAAANISTHKIAENVEIIVEEVIGSPRRLERSISGGAKGLLKRVESLKCEIVDVVESVEIKMSPPSSPKKTSPTKNTTLRMPIPFPSLSLAVKSSKNFVRIHDMDPAYDKTSLFLYKVQPGTFFSDEKGTSLVPVPKCLDNVGSQLADNHLLNADYSAHVKSKMEYVPGRKLDAFHNITPLVKQYGDWAHVTVNDFRLHPDKKSYWEKQLGGTSLVKDRWFELEIKMPAQVRKPSYLEDNARQEGPMGEIEFVVLAEGLTSSSKKTIVHQFYRAKK
jgi:ankyrin repeat protein